MFSRRSSSPGGSSGIQRTLKFAQYLPAHGWQPLVLTVRNDLPVAVQVLLAVKVRGTRGLSISDIGAQTLAPGQRTTIDVDAYGGREFTGKVDSIAGATGARFSLLPPENATGNFVKVVQRVPVKIVLDAGQDPEHLLRPGMSVVPTVFTK